MGAISFNGLLIIGAVAIVVPALLGLFQNVTIPAAVLEIVGGAIVGPQVLGWVHPDAAIQVTSDLGLGYLLFLAGYEIDLSRLQGRLLTQAGQAFVLSAVLAVAVGYALQLVTLVHDGLLVGLILTATSLGILVPVLKDIEETETPLGRLILAAGSLAELIPLIVLSVFFSAGSTNPGVELGLLGGFLLFTVIAAVLFQRAHRWAPLVAILSRFQDSTSQLRVRIAITLALAFGVVAEHFGLAMILGAFLAGVIVRMAEPAESAVHPMFRVKLEAIGFGFLVPVFFVSTGIALDLRSLLHSTVSLVSVPVFLVVLLAVRGIPALLYVPLLGRKRAMAAAFLQATSLTFIVVAADIGVQTHHLQASTAAALVVAGLCSVIIYPWIAIRLLAQEAPSATATGAEAAPPTSPAGLALALPLEGDAGSAPGLRG
jgi:Kef-type K+ transport system membrane component KefB